MCFERRVEAELLGVGVAVEAENRAEVARLQIGAQIEMHLTVTLPGVSRVPTW